MNWYKKAFQHMIEDISNLSGDNPYPFSSWFDKTGRAIIPINHKNEKNMTESDRQVISLLEENGYPVVDYFKGLCLDKYKRQYSIGKALNAIEKEVDKNENLNQEYPLFKEIDKGINEKKKNSKEEVSNARNIFMGSTYRTQGKSDNFYILLTENPYDVAYMSTEKS